MNKRLELHEMLCECVGSRHVYFQPPESVKMSYPCIVYERAGEDAVFADDGRYLAKKQYTVTVIDKDPDSEIPHKVGELLYSSFSRHYTADNLHHDVYNVYY